MTARNKREYLKQLVSGKNEWSRRLTDEERELGFLGWHERGYLPHCDVPDLIQFVTFRLYDSMPVSRRGEWEHLLKIESIRDRRVKLEEYLDRGIGYCQLRDKKIAAFAEDALLYFHQQRYEILGWIVMPNHVHVLVHVWQIPLSKFIQSWKRAIATESAATSNMNAPARRAALQWQREYRDTFMRDTDQERKAIAYTENNPVKAGLCAAPEDWPFSSARFRDGFRRLELPEKVAYAE